VRGSELERVSTLMMVSEWELAWVWVTELETELVFATEWELELQLALLYSK
jgi:hypothetical protein